MNKDIESNSENINDTSIIKTAKNIFKELFDWSESLLISLLAVVIVFTFFARTSVVDGDSMLPTLMNKEFLLVSHFIEDYNYNDIIVFWAKDYRGIGYENGKPLIKRIIGLEGDVIDIDFDNGIVYRNGTALPLEETDGLIYEDGHAINNYTTNRLNMQGAVTVPEGCVFVMGDNRNDSLDSRCDDVGFVDRHYIIGKAFLRVLPFNKFGSVY